MLSPWGFGAQRAMYPSDMNGPFGSPGKPLPTYTTSPAYYGPVPYTGEGFTMHYGKRACSFGSAPGDRLLTPGGVTTERGWGFQKFGKINKSKRKSKKKSKKTKKTKRKSIKKQKRNRLKRSIKK